MAKSYLESLLSENEKIPCRPPTLVHPGRHDHLELIPVILALAITRIFLYFAR
jgi:hypothetical protein